MSWLLKLFTPSQSKDDGKMTPNKDSKKTVESDVTEFKINEEELDNKITEKIKKVASAKKT